MTTNRTAVELTHDRRFEARIRRLSVVSLVALGAITWLAIRDDASPIVLILLVVGWIMMPTVLRASLTRPRLRYALTLPATAVVVGLVAFSLTGDLTGASAAGWWTITASVGFGAVLGMWLWYRWVPVPRALDDPFSWARLALVALHIGGVLIGLGLVLA